MARQLGLNTVAKWFNALSFEKQQEALAYIQGEHEHARSAKRDELEKQLAELGFPGAKRRGQPRKTNSVAGGRKASVKAKYRDPKTRETWSGRGRMATWLKNRQDAGEKIEKYLV